MATLALRAAAVSECGPHRASNQDAAFTAAWGAGVADGVGGETDGDLASAAYVHRLAAGLSSPLDRVTLAERWLLCSDGLTVVAAPGAGLSAAAPTFAGSAAERFAEGLESA